MPGASLNRIPFINGDEQDVLTGWRSAYRWTKRAGATSAVKRRYRRRERQVARKQRREDANSCNATPGPREDYTTSD